MNFNLLGDFTDRELRDAMRAIKAEMTRRSICVVGDTVNVIASHPIYGKKTGVAKKIPAWSKTFMTVDFGDSSYTFHQSQLRKVRKI